MSIPYFDNLAESLNNLNIRFVHPDLHLVKLEDIPQKRMYDVSTFRVNTFWVGLLTEGEVTMTINAETHHLARGSVVFMNPWNMRKYSNIRDWKGFALFFTPQYLFQYNGADAFIKEFPFFNPETNMVMKADEGLIERLVGLFTKIETLLKSENPDRYKVVFHYINILLFECKYAYGFVELKTLNSAENITKQFFDLVNDYFILLAKGTARFELTLTDVAQQLHLHPNYLSNLLKEQTGKTAAQLIRDRVGMEAQSLLKNTNSSISEVSYYLKFKDTSNFAKFFKNYAGMSPTQFREQGQM